MSAVLKGAFSLTRVSFWTGVLVSSLIGTAAYVMTSRSIESDARERFVNHARYAQSLIAMRVKQYTDLLRGGVSLIQSADVLTHRQLHEYVRGLDLSKNFPAVDSINFALYLNDDQRPEYVSNLRAEMQRYVDTTEPLDITPPGRRPNYLVVTYVEPDLATPGHYGVDLLSNRYFNRQLLHSRDTGKLYAAGTPIPVLSTPNDVHLGLRMPVYRMGAPLDTVEQRRAAYFGSLGIAFSLPKLLHGVMDEVPIPDMRMVLYDVGVGLDAKGHNASGRPLVLFDNRGGSANSSPALDSGNGVFSTTLPLDFNGCPWRVVYSVSKSSLSTEFDAYYPKLMMMFGFLGSILLYALLYTLTSSRRAALELAQEMTSELRESQNKLQLSHQKLRRLADHAYQIKELERKRIAREIHDDLGQNLLALRIEADLLASRTSARHHQLHARAKRTLQQIDMTIKSVRQIINDLRPNVLDLGLGAAVDWQVAQFRQRTGIVCDVMEDLDDMAIDDGCATALFRILQESLTNISRHAQATRVRVELRLLHARITMTISDNGVGMDASNRHKPGSFGLVGIEERVKILGGTFTVTSRPGAGTTIEVSVSAALNLAVPAPIMPAPALPSVAAMVRKLTRV